MEPSVEERREEFIGKLIKFIEEKYIKELAAAHHSGNPLVIDYKLLDIFDHELSELLTENPDDFFDMMNEAIDHVSPGSNVKVEITNTQEVMIRNIRAAHVGKFFCVEGIVRKASEIRPQVVSVDWQCMNCKEIINEPVRSGSIFRPLLCPSCGERKNFKEVKKEMIDVRRITIEEPFELTEGEKPSQLTVILTGNLVSPEQRNFTDPGNRLKVYGVLKEFPKGKKNSVNLDFYFLANHFEPVEAGWKHLKITKEDERKIKELAKDPKIYEKFVNSIAPSLYGMEVVKEAIVLQMFGGVERKIKGTTFRGDIHILLIGDPASGKSQLLKFVPEVVPRGRYVSGKGVTGAGLTATVTRDEQFSGEWVLEAGALVLANKGLLAVDEFEKMSKDDQVAMHEALEQGTISIAKASIIATLPAKTSVLAGGNPISGRFDPYISISKQISIPPTLLSRFDLKFPLRDVPNYKRDEKIVDHILRMRSGEEGEEKGLDMEFMRKYIAYAKQHCKPELSEDAKKILKDFYLKTRKVAEGMGASEAVPIALRQFEALIRLAEASAKVQLSPVVRKEDAERAIRLMGYSFKELGYSTELGTWDVDKMEGFPSASEREKRREIINIIEELFKENKEVKIEEVKERARKKNISEKEVEKVIEEMKLQGEIFQPSPGFIQKT